MFVRGPASLVFCWKKERKPWTDVATYDKDTVFLIICSSSTIYIYIARGFARTQRRTYFFLSKLLFKETMGCSAMFTPRRQKVTFGSRSTALEVSKHAEGLRGKTALVTGGNAGIGKETVRALYAAGCDVILCCRNVASGEQAIEEIMMSGEGNNRIYVYQLDLSDLCSVEACVARMKENFDSLDILILNAGCISKTLKHTKQGFEEGFGVNFVAQYYLTTKIVHLMKNPGCRIVGLSSTAHWMGNIHIDDLNFEKTKFSGWKSYGQSKLAMLLYMKYLAVKFEKDSIDNIKVFSVHPGAIRTQLVDGTKYARLAFAMFGFLCKSPEQGAACTVYAATLCEEKSGSYLEDCHLGLMSRKGNDLDMAERLIQATEEELAKRFNTQTPMYIQEDKQRQDESSCCDDTDLRTRNDTDEMTAMKPLTRKGTISVQVQIS